MSTHLSAAHMSREEGKAVVSSFSFLLLFVSLPSASHAPYMGKELDARFTRAETRRRGDGWVKNCHTGRKGPELSLLCEPAPRTSPPRTHGDIEEITA